VNRTPTQGFSHIDISRSVHFVWRYVRNSGPIHYTLLSEPTCAPAVRHHTARRRRVPHHGGDPVRPWARLDRILQFSVAAQPHVHVSQGGQRGRGRLRSGGAMQLGTRVEIRAENLC
jgi:hypothetical protein